MGARVCVCARQVGRASAWVVSALFPSSLLAYRRRLGNSCLPVKEILLRLCKMPTSLVKCENVQKLC